MTSLGLALSAALVQFLWQGALVALLYWVAESLLRRSSAQARYVAGCIALAVLSVLPAVTAFALYRPLQSGGTGLAARDWTLPLWAAGVLLFSIRPIRSLARIRALRRAGTQAEAWIAELGAAVAQRMGCSRAFRILMCAVSETPSAIGWLKPAILLPAATVAGLTVEQLEAVLAHEIAHIRRRDYLVNVLQVAVETLLFYQPAVWWISSRVRFERELCCDDEAVRATGNALGYARALTLLEKLRVPAPALSGAGGSLRYRVLRLVGEAQPARSLWPAMAALALALLCLTTGVRWVHAQEVVDDKVTVEVTRDQQGTHTRVLSGPEYLRPIALLAIGPQLAPERRVQTITFPDAFRIMTEQHGTISQFFEDEAAQTEKELAEAERQSLDTTALREKLWKFGKQQELTDRARKLILLRPARMWADALRQRLDTLDKGSPQYEKTLRALADTEKLLQEIAAK